MRLATVSAEESWRPGKDLQDSPEGRALGDYQLIEEIARGGMGVVYRARQLSLKRTVAVKVLLAADFANQTSRQRFRREAEAAAGLNHPNIVSIYEVGEQENQPYFAMEMIEGQNLAELTREKPAEAEQAARWLKTIAEAVHFAHQRGVLHRDLKPSNVLLDRQNVPHITDFGLAKQSEAGASLTLSGQVLGTPSFMPPEQADPKRGATTAASDVYSLGALLYHLLTTRPPFMADTLTKTLRLVAEGEPVSPRLLNPGVPADLETICLKCLEKEPTRRYSSAQNLADELGLYLRGEPIKARPVGAAGRLVRWCRRKPALAAATGSLLALLLVVAIGSPIALIRINASRSLAQAAQRQTQRQLYNALLEQARATIRSGELGQRVRALDAVSRAAAITNSPELRQVAFAALSLPDLRLEREIPTDPPFTAERLDSKFERVAQCRGHGPVEIRLLADGKLLTTLPAVSYGVVFVLVWSPDGRYLAVRREKDQIGSLEVWEVDGPRLVLQAGDAPYLGVDFFPNSQSAMAGTRRGSVVVWDLPTGKEMARFWLPVPPRVLHYSADGERFAAAFDANQHYFVSVHRARDGAQLTNAPLSSPPSDLAWNLDGRWIGVTDEGGSVHLLDPNTGQIRTLGRHRAEAATAVFSPDGGFLLTGGYERELICWDMNSLERAFPIGLNSFTAQFRTDGSQCAIIAKNVLQIHSFLRPRAHRDLPGGLRGLRPKAAFSQDNRWLAVADEERLGVWDLIAAGPGTLIAEGAGTQVVFSDRGELFANKTNGCSRWRITAGTNGGGPRLEALPLPAIAGTTSVFPLTNGMVVTSVGGSRLVSWEDLDSQNVGHLSPSHYGNSAVSPDGRWLAVRREQVGDDGVVLYHLPGLEEAVRIAIHPYAVEFSPRSDRLAGFNVDRVTLWDTTTWRIKEQLTNHMGLIFDPGGRGWWLTTTYRAAGLFDAQTRESLLPLPVGVLPLALSPDGRYLAVSVDDKRLQVWDMVEVRQQFRELGIDWKDD